MQPNPPGWTRACREAPPSPRRTMVTIDLINFSADSEPGSPSLILTTGTSITRMACKKKILSVRTSTWQPVGLQIQPDIRMSQKARTSNKCQPKSGKKSSENSKCRLVDSPSRCFLPLIKLYGCAPTAEWEQGQSISKSLAIWQLSYAFSRAKIPGFLHPQLYRHLKEHLNLTQDSLYNPEWNTKNKQKMRNSKKNFPSEFFDGSPP